MIQPTKQPQKNIPNNTDEITKFKENDMAPKGTTKHIVETDWPTQEAAGPVEPKDDQKNNKDKKREIKHIQTASLP